MLNFRFFGKILSEVSRQPKAPLARTEDIHKIEYNIFVGYIIMIHCVNETKELGYKNDYFCLLHCRDLHNCELQKNRIIEYIGDYFERKKT